LAQGLLDLTAAMVALTTAVSCHDIPNFSEDEELQKRSSESLEETRGRINKAMDAIGKAVKI
jgi:uncharacterized FlaG/YvyC family protein